MTRKVMEMNGDDFLDLIIAVREYEFSEDDDHDYGKVEIGDQMYIWKIDYYDKTYTYGVDEKQRNTDECRRVLTIMHSDEC